MRVVIQLVRGIAICDIGVRPTTFEMGYELEKSSVMEEVNRGKNTFFHFFLVSFVLEVIAQGGSPVSQPHSSLPLGN